MINRAVARRYAQALFALGEERGQLDGLEEDLKFIIETLKSEPDFLAALENQRVSGVEKHELIERAFADQCSTLALNFLRLLVLKHREAYVEDIYAEFRKLADEARGIQEAQVTVAEELDDETLELVRQSLEQLTGKKIRMRTSIDPEIIGGLIVRIGDQRYDASVRRQLARLERALKGRGEKRKGVTIG